MRYMPISFLIPGQVEAWFGGGLRTGRYFAFLLGILLLVAVWILARRLGGRWGGAAAVWALALSPMVIQDYSLITTDVLVACMLAWTLVLVTGRGRPLWQILLGACLCGLVMMTRQNMLPAVPIIVAYIFWQHGRKAGWWALAASALPIVAIIAFYWPRILGLFDIWLPILRSFSSDHFPDPFTDAVPYRNTVLAGLNVKLMALLEGFRFNYFALVGALSTLFLWPSPSKWKDWEDKKTAIFLAALFLALLALHGWASLGNNFSPFSFASYLNYFNFVAILLVILSIRRWEKKPSGLRVAVIVIVVTSLFAGLAYSAYITPSYFGSAPSLLARTILLWIVYLPIPWLRGGSFVAGGIPLSTLLANKFHWDIDILQGLPFSPAAKQITFVLFVLVCTWILLSLVYTGYRLATRRKVRQYSFGALAMITVLLAGYVIAPAVEGEYAEAAYCLTADMLDVYEQAGAELADSIPPGSRVYWGADSPTLLLYLPGVEIPPAQLYGGYTRRVGGDTDALLREGYWNDEAASGWLEAADYVVLTWDNLDTVDAGAFDLELLRAIPLNPCYPEHQVYVFGRSR